jgi:release factor glutamine methyltransferase
MNVGQWLVHATSELATSSDSPRIDAEYLLLHVLQKPRSFLIAFSDELLTPDQLQLSENVLQRRVRGEPVAYIVGMQGFWSLLLKTTSATLIPRPETELLVEAALQLLPQTSASILDIGTGTGAIALAIASERVDCVISASDISNDALLIAQENARHLNLKNLTFKVGSFCEPWLDKQFDMIVSNPPYICENDIHLDQGDVRFEPKLALTSGADGLDAICAISSNAPKILKPNGWLLIEHGFDQGQQVRSIFADNGFSHIETLKDLNGLDRVCKAQKLT